MAPKWYNIIVPALAAVSPMWLARIPLPLPAPLAAVVCGALVALVAYIVLAFVPVLKETHALGKAVLLGILVSEVLIFHASTLFPRITAIALFMFLYMNSVETLTLESAAAAAAHH